MFRRSLFLVVIIVLGAILCCNCGQTTDQAYLALFDHVSSSYDPGFNQKVIEMLSHREIEIPTEDGAKDSLDANYSGGLTAIDKFNEWAEEANGILCRDTKLRESRNYLVLSLVSQALILQDLFQLGRQQMMSKTPLDGAYVEERVSKMVAASELAVTSYAEAAKLVEEYKKENPTPSQ